MKFITHLFALLLPLATALAVQAQSTISVTTPITVPDGSFESSYGSTNGNPNIASGWIFNVNPGDYYGVLSISSGYSSEGAALGSNYAYLTNDNPGITETITSAASLGTITADTTYTLSVAVGNPSAQDTELYGQPGPVSLSLLANGQAFATQTVPNGSVANGTFDDFSLTYTTPDSGSVIGENLTIQLASLPEHGTAYVPGFDNVQLEETTIEDVPEPSTLLLLGAAGIALWWLMNLRTRRSNGLPGPGFAVLIAACFALDAQHSASATAVDLPNASFESPTSPAQTSKSPTILPGWVFDVQGGSEYGSMTFRSANFSSAGSADGNNYAFINNDYPGVTDTLTSASSLATIAPLTTYTLTVAIGNRNGTGLYNDPGNVSFSLLADGVAFATQEVTNGTVPNGTFEEFSLSYTTSSTDPIIGDDLTIQLATLPEQGNAFQAGFDNVTLDETAIEAAPEPTTALLLVFGGVALIGFARLSRFTPVPLTAGLEIFSFMAAGIAPASADPIDVPDNSFETGGGWTYSDPDIIPGWIFNAPTGSSYGSLFQGACFTKPDASEGNQFAYIDNDVAGAEASLTSASTLGTITADTTYTLTVALGSPDAVFQGGPLDFDPVSGVAPAGAWLALLANGQPFAIDPVPAGLVSSGTWQDFSFTYTTTDSDPIVGGQLTIQLGTDLNPGEAEEASFDNVRLDASAIDTIGDGDSPGDGDGGSGMGTTPEPSSAGLLGLGLAGFGCLSRWQRFKREALL